MDSILVERAAGVVTVTFTRPERKNALRYDDWAALTVILAEVADRPDDRVVVLTGAGGDFCAGADLSAYGQPTEPGGRVPTPLEALRIVGAAAVALHGLPKPTIAKVDGVAVGAGLNMALCCDLVVASERARLSEIFVRRGLSLDFGGSWLLPQIVGLQRAKELALLGDIIEAGRALELGLVNRVVPVDELDAFVDDWAQRLAAGPPIALSLTKAMLDAGVTTTLAQAVETEAYAQSSNLGTADVKEAMTAFLERRDPVFRGR